MGDERRADVLTGWQVTPGVSLADARDQFLQDAHNAGRSPKTILFYDWQLSPFIAWLASERRIHDLNALDARAISDYFGHERDRGLKPNSVHAAARAIRAWCGFLVRVELLSDSPMRKVKMPKKGRHILPAFSPADMRALLGACTNDRDRAMILCLLDSGCRASEFVALNVGDVNLRSGAVFVRGGKGDKDRVTRIGERARRALAAYLAERPGVDPTVPLWVSLTGAARLTTSGLGKFCRRLGESAGVSPCGPHEFRRTCALTLHRSGARLTEIAGLLGHADLATLQRYLDLQAADYADAHIRHGPVDHMDL
jgi:integrase/recombinase XerD